MSKTRELRRNLQEWLTAQEALEKLLEESLRHLDIARRLLSGMTPEKTVEIAREPTDEEIAALRAKLAASPPVMIEVEPPQPALINPDDIHSY